MQPILKKRQINWYLYSVMLLFGLIIFISSIFSAFKYILEANKTLTSNQAYDYFILLQAHRHLDLITYRLRLASLDPTSSRQNSRDNLDILEQLGITLAKLDVLSEGENAERLRKTEKLPEFIKEATNFFDDLELILDEDLNRDKPPEQSRYQKEPNYLALYDQARKFSHDFIQFTDAQKRLLTIQKEILASEQSFIFYFGFILISGFTVLALYFFALRRTVTISKVLAQTNVELAAESERLRQAKEEIDYRAKHDFLTGLINRSEFEERLKAIAEKAKLNNELHALCYMDLDQFKVVNDTCGHAAGDQLLKQLGGELQRKVRPQDTFARLGGDEFAALLLNVSYEEAEDIAEVLRRTVQNFRFVWERQFFEIRVSIGVVRIGGENTVVSAILSDADAACFTAKQAGRNRVNMFAPDNESIRRHKSEMAWVTRINKAFEENRFRLYYQPIVPINPDHHEKAHYEILIRMLDEEGKIVPPISFLPAAERFSLMPNLDRWIVQNLFEFVMSNKQILDDLSVCSINLSGTSVMDKTFVAFVVEQLDYYQMPTEKVCFEITETAAIANLTEASEFIRFFKDRGCKFSLDDFGSGMSSFAYLKNLPVDYLKIDGSFVKDMVKDNVDRAMVEAIHRVGYVMQLETIAEYVENQEILRALREIGVTYAQGYGVGKPTPLTLATYQRSEKYRVIL